MTLSKNSSAECDQQTHYYVYHYAQCRYAECHLAECFYAEGHYAECHFAEGHFAECYYSESCRVYNHCNKLGQLILATKTNYYLAREQCFNKSENKLLLTNHPSLFSLNLFIFC
jgi:hypothetical protein